MELVDELGGTDYRSRDKLREEAEVEAEIEEIPYRGNPAAFYIHNVTYRLESEEGDSDRKEDTVNAENGAPGNLVSGPCKYVKDPEGGA